MMPSDEEIADIKRRATPALLAIPGVVAVGLGSKEVAGSPTGQLVIKVYVREKRPAAEVPEGELIPPQIEGVPTDVVVGGDLVRLADPAGGLPTESRDRTRYRPLSGGARIKVVDSGHGGTLGCLLRHTTDSTKFYGLTNEHVIKVADVSPITVGSTKVGQPEGKDSCTDCCDDFIGAYAGGGESDDRDEALVQLLPGTQWLAEILEIGVVSGRHTVTQAEAGTGTYKVRKRGGRTRLTGGVISSLQATTSTADNLIIVTPNANPAATAGQTVFFAYEGDSGSALVNHANKVIGLVFARDDAGLGYAYPIAGVLSRLASVESISVEVATVTTPGVVNTVPGAAMIGLPPELAPELGPAGVPVSDPPGALVAPGAPGRPRSTATPGPKAKPVPVLAPVGGWLAGPQPELAGGVTRVQRDLDRSPTGRLLIGLWLEHQHELMRLVNGDRRVTIAWHRSGGAALFQLLIRMVSRPDVALPRTVNGQPLAAVMDRLRDVLIRVASPALRADLQRVRAALPDVAGLTYPEIISALDRA